MSGGLLSGLTLRRRQRWLQSSLDGGKDHNDPDPAGTAASVWGRDLK